MAGARIGKHGVVIGAGIAGLSAARALAGHVEHVVVLERDDLADKATPRAGVPQGRHTHILLCGGMNAIAGLFPNIEEDLVQAGAVPLNCGLDFRYEHPDHEPFPKRDLGLRTYSLTRPSLELILRRRVEKEPNIVLCPRHRALEILGAPDGSRVTAVRCDTADKRGEILAADIVVDASGRGAPTLAFLESSGRGRPRETTMGVDLSYSTAAFAIPDHALPDFAALASLPKAPEGSRCGYMLRIEGDRWHVVLVGRGADCPPGEADAYMEFARELTTPTVYNAIKDAEQLGDIARFSFPESVWRLFARMEDFPRGLLPIGDAICRFNPVYGQGMSVATKEAGLLHHALQTHAVEPDPLATLAQDFLADAEKLIETPWAASALPDLIYPQTRGERPADLEERLKFQGALNRIAVRDPAIHKLLFEVQYLVKPVSALDDPKIAEKVAAEMAKA
jgi:2-polyprenyl-6-methoxyphenol hydroxylase-like FAD-dependent oxidoreductase